MWKKVYKLEKEIQRLQQQTLKWLNDPPHPTKRNGWKEKDASKSEAIIKADRNEALHHSEQIGGNKVDSQKKTNRR